MCIDTWASVNPLRPPVGAAQAAARWRKTALPAAVWKRPACRSRCRSAASEIYRRRRHSLMLTLPHCHSASSPERPDQAPLTMLRHLHPPPDWRAAPSRPKRRLCWVAVVLALCWRCAPLCETANGVYGAAVDFGKSACSLTVMRSRVNAFQVSGPEATSCCPFLLSSNREDLLGQKHQNQVLVTDCTMGCSAPWGTFISYIYGH